VFYPGTSDDANIWVEIAILFLLSYYNVAAFYGFNGYQIK